METLILLTEENSKLYVAPLINERTGDPEAWIVSNKTFPVLRFFTVPTYNNPEEMWESLAPEVQYNIKTEGWVRYGTRKHAIAYAIQYGNVSPTYLHYYCLALTSSKICSDHEISELVKDITDAQTYSETFAGGLQSDPAWSLFEIGDRSGNP